MVPSLTSETKEDFFIFFFIFFFFFLQRVYSVYQSAHASHVQKAIRPDLRTMVKMVSDVFETLKQHFLTVSC